VVARDRRLSPEIRNSLQRLELLAPSTRFSEILKTICHEVSDAEGLSIAGQALAEGSVGVVVPFTLRESGSSTLQHGVFKLLKPGVKELLHEELDIFSALGPFLEEQSASYGLPQLTFRETLGMVRRQLLSEIRLDREQAHLREATALYADFPQVLIPRVFPFSTPSVTAMERVRGTKVTQSHISAGEKKRLAEVIAEALIAMPFWSTEPVGVFHADPHAGNLFRTCDGRLSILDWSLVVRLGKAERVKIVQLLLAALTLDEAGLCRAVAGLAETRPDDAVLRAVVGEALRRVRTGTFPGFDWMLGMLDRFATSCRVVFSEELTLFRKALLALTGTLIDVSEEKVADRVLIRTGIVRLAGEFFARGLVPLDSRDLGTHLSNEDLLRLWTSWPVAAARFWLGVCQDLLADRHRQE
jgi:ubiquinone biosynthesis protein